ncbi:MAG: hypothetical protein QG610_2312, partial [Euryarchaeota archaeon]|nr:hypothetical protein [Euryarchaeota archaeon]
MIQSWIYIR